MAPKGVQAVAGYPALLEAIKNESLRAAWCRLRRQSRIDRALSVDWPGYSFPPEGRGFGAKIIDRLARIREWNSLVSKGFSVRNLKYMRAFAEACRD
jgi:hypothetical protein